MEIEAKNIVVERPHSTVEYVLLKQIVFKPKKKRITETMTDYQSLNLTRFVSNYPDKEDADICNIYKIASLLKGTHRINEHRAIIHDGRIMDQRGL